MLPDLVRCYGACGRTIIFTETKRDANELLNVLSEARALHGDIPQAGVPLTGLVGCSHCLCPMATDRAVQSRLWPPALGAEVQAPAGNESQLFYCFLTCDGCCCT